MSYTFTGQQVQKLYGQKFSIKNVDTDAVETIDIQAKQVFRARRGNEGYGLRAFHRHQKVGNLHAFLKVFGMDIPQRYQRSEFLVRLGLAKHHEWVFQGVPYARFDRQNVKGAEIVGHLSKFIGLQYGQAAEDFSVLKDDGQWDAYSPVERRSFAAHLASAVDALERLDLVHGDLSAGNLMIGPGPEGRHICCLCDFDGFFHPSQEMLPRKFDGVLTRPLGSSGYRYVELIKRARADKNDDDENLFVESDRFALAVLICEMMVWSADLGKMLGRAELLDEDVIVSRKLSDIPDRTKDSFSEGFALLEKALHAGSCQDMPTPDDWLRCLGGAEITERLRESIEREQIVIPESLKPPTYHSPRQVLPRDSRTPTVGLTSHPPMHGAIERRRRGCITCALVRWRLDSRSGCHGPTRFLMWPVRWQRFLTC